MLNYSIKKVEVGDFQSMVILMKNCFDIDVNINYFKWKYIDNPAGEFIGFFAIENQTKEIGAYYGVIPQKMIINGIEQIIYQSCDTMTHANHRRKGLFQLLAKHCYEYLNNHHQLFVIGFGGKQSNPGLLKFGWKQLFNFVYYFKPNLLCHFYKFRNYEMNRFEKAKIENLIPLFDDKKNKVFSSEIYSPRTIEYFKWRIQNPQYKYQIISFKSDNKIDGYIIYYNLRNKLFVFDFMCHTEKAEKALFWYLSKQVVIHNYKGVFTFCQQNGDMAHLFCKNKYILNCFNVGVLHEKVPFTYYAPNDKFVMTNDSKWIIMSYDHDAL